MIKIRGNRIYFTPATDADAERKRAFAFLDPSVKSYDRLVAEATTAEENGVASIDAGRLVHLMLRGWSNVRTDDADVARRYGVAVPDGGRADAIDVPFPTSAEAIDAIDLQDLLPLREWRELVDAVFGAIVPVASGNSASPASSRPGESAGPASAGATATPRPTNS